MKSHPFFYAVLISLLYLSTSFEQSHAQDSEESSIKTTQILQTSASWNGAKISYPDTESAEFTALYYEFSPGSETPWHRHPVPVLAYVLSGKLQATVKESGETKVFGPGDAFAEVINTWHAGKVVGNEPVELIVFFLGENGSKLTELLSETKEE